VAKGGSGRYHDASGWGAAVGSATEKTETAQPAGCCRWVKAGSPRHTRFGAERCTCTGLRRGRYIMA
jgi:hypothetical protein